MAVVTSFSSSSRNSFLTYHPALWAPLLQLEEGNEVTLICLVKQFFSSRGRTFSVPWDENFHLTETDFTVSWDGFSL